MDNHSASLQKTTIRGLEPFLSNCFLVAIIIGKQKPKKLAIKENESRERAVWNFTIRDSPRDYINVVFWGGAEDLFALNDKFQIGDIVHIQKPRIEIRRVGDFGEQFHPMVTSPFKLTLTEGESELITVREGFDSLLPLFHMPTKPIANYVTLSDLHANLNSTDLANGPVVDILVSIRSVGNIRNVNTRVGEKEVRTLVVFDHTNPGLNITVWDSEYIVRANIWKPRLTILFMTDMKVGYDAFHRCANAEITRRTIITEDPVCKEAEQLRQYALSAALEPSAILDQMVCAIPDPDSINKVMNIRQIVAKINTMCESFSINPDDNQFTALLYATVTQIDLDGLNKVISTRCIRCKHLIRNDENQCENEQCTIGMGHETMEAETHFDLRLKVSDAAGTLINCRLNGRNAETVLKCTIQEFKTMSDEEKIAIKWKFLMERCDLRIMVLCVQGRTPLISILSCKKVDPSKLVNNF